MRARWPVIAALLASATIAGCDPSDDPATEQATRDATHTPLTSAAEAFRSAGLRAGHTTTPLPDGRLLVAGGCVVDGCGIATDETFVVSPSERWAKPGPAMSAPRVNQTATALPDGRVLLTGGFLGEGAGVTGSVDVFDPVSNDMTELASLHQPRGGHEAVALSDGRVLVVGGWVAPDTYTSSAEVIDPVSGSVTRVEHLPWAADALAAASLGDGSVLVTGGQVEPGVGTPSAAVFDPSIGLSSSVPPMASARLKHDAVTLRTGQVLVMGGTPDDRKILASTEIYDLVSNQFVPGPTMTEPRYKFSGGATVLHDGRVLVAGGGRTIEVLDTRKGTSQRVADLGSRASFATVTPLLDREAFVVGGYDNRIRLIGLASTFAVPR